MHTLPVTFFVAAALAQGQTVLVGGVIGVGNFIHNVANLDKSLEFYHEVLGMELQRAPGTQASAASGRPFISTPEILNLYNATGGHYRVGTALVPELPMRAELVEFRDIDRRAVQLRIQDPGASIYILSVRDLTPVMARVKQSGATVITTGGEPVMLADRSHAVLLKDPDGFFVELVQRNPAPAKAPADSNFTDVSFAFVVSDTDRMMRVFKDALGFQPRTGAFLKDKTQWRLLGIKSAQVRQSTALVPGSSFQVDFFEFKGIDRKPVHGRPQDPGAAVLRLLVRDVDSAVKDLDAIGVKVASAGGQAVSIPAGSLPSRAAIARAPDNLFVQLFQPAPTQPAGKR
jgi:catechol 2,3-dioxygenase-like lactoylglutathione lyase family enzyme